MNDSRRRPGDHCQQCADRRASGNAKNEGVCQRVAEESLQEHSGECEQTADTKPGQESRQPHLHHHRARGFVTTSGQRSKRIANTNPGAAYDERSDGDRSGQDEEHREASPSRGGECRVMRDQAA